jgi:Type II site-specific deoxyribonuclease
MSAAGELVALIEQLSEIQIRILSEVATAMRRQIDEVSNPESDIVTEPFRVSFKNRLLLHHATNEAKLTKKAFEYAFKHASNDAGRAAEITNSDTYPGADVIVSDVAFSLKTEASKAMSLQRLTISKLSEARWIQQCSSLEELAENTAKRIPEHLTRYQRIVMLRALNLSENKVLYQLIEIPISVLMLVQHLKVADFTRYTSQGGSSAIVKNNGLPAFMLRLDGSDGKVTISGLDLNLCIKHAEWSIPLGVPTDEGELNTPQTLFS